MGFIGSFFGAIILLIIPAAILTNLIKKENNFKLFLIILIAGALAVTAYESGKTKKTAQTTVVSSYSQYNDDEDYENDEEYDNYNSSDYYIDYSDLTISEAEDLFGSDSEEFREFLYNVDDEEFTEYFEERLYDSLFEVDSSAIYLVGYFDIAGEDILAIVFRNHDEDIYLYYDVPESVYEKMINADSIGSYYNKHIKGQYDSEKIS